MFYNSNNKFQLKHNTVIKFDNLNQKTKHKIKQT